MTKEILSIAFAAPKGGVGKSTFTVLCSSYLHYLAGKNVITIDCDFPQFSINAMRDRDLQQVNSSSYYKNLAYNQFTRLNKRAYPILCASPDKALNVLNNHLQSEANNCDVAFFDIPGTVNAAGVLSILTQLDYIFIPISADYVVLDSCLKFANVIQENIINPGNSRVKGMYLFWNMVNGLEKTDIYDVYEGVIKDLGLTLLNTCIPTSIKYKKEILTDRQTVFRSTLFPPNSKQLSGSYLKELIKEMRDIIKL